MDRKRLGAALKKAREDKKLTQAELAQKIGYTSPQFVSNIERGVTVFPQVNVKRYAKALDLNPEKLLRQIYDAKFLRAKEKYL